MAKQAAEAAKKFGKLGKKKGPMAGVAQTVSYIEYNILHRNLQSLTLQLISRPKKKKKERKKISLLPKTFVGSQISLFIRNIRAGFSKKIYLYIC